MASLFLTRNILKKHCVAVLFRFDIQSQTYADTDTLSLYFTKAKQSVITNTDHITTGIVADYDNHGKLVSLDIRAASKKTSCHFFNTGAEVDGKPPLAVNWHYNTEYQQLVVLLSLQDVSIITNIMETDDPNVSLGMDLIGKLCAVYVSNPVSNTFTAAKMD
ncbi:hypothetical protein VOLCADRAFT_95550 [Volvox carteri f. nagariensis]|uniref:Uncharacterized protein n=1 Tax=Volvox carteri f. nagariensis TaxID=3068 RepID=D8U7S2_VOLCA|nr:uncharacterized protein VOLCADRAFT_95550 [Volvox carteri f. nagariensis]EFJ44351.1 hypothetical protein VOLCADRAFT_95550 [Volvox carteri f. nagariensis]|eukprot:XP_002954710.1 hypothetical protein VOLCADRAFT_95550 [Volvox carteri f. nagariensis]